jgi:sulfide:quinone oxidoreductase
MLQTGRNKKKPAVFRKLDDDFWLAGCLDESDLVRAASQGVATIINILPEDDELCQLSDQDARAISGSLGMAYKHMPIYGHQLNNEFFARAFGYLICETTGPKIVYCRTGMRSAFLWGMIHAADLGVDEVLDRTLDIGFDLAVIEDDLAKMARKTSPLADLAKVA